jgi:hypothetical protein
MILQKRKKSRMGVSRPSSIQQACRPVLTGFFVFVSLVMIATSCDTSKMQGGAAGKIMPNITGGAGEVLVVMDNFNWDNSTGELMKDILMEEVPGLPQSEPLFDVIQITAASFDGFYQFHRSIILTTISSDLEPRIRFRENVYARPQIMVQLEAPSSGVLLELIEENADRIQGFLVQADRQRLMDIYRDTKDPAIQKEIADHHQIRLAIPRGYNLDFSTETYSSVSIEAPDLSQVIQVYDYPADGPEDLNTENLIAKRNEFTKQFVEGPRENSYMIIAPMYKPIAFDLMINDKEIVELRGLWELENGYMGGPFVSHSIYDAKRNRIVVVDGYVYYPNQKKRVKIKQLEAIIYSMEVL